LHFQTRSSMRRIRFSTASEKQYPAVCNEI
jgi:hypothetical protein